MAEAKFKFAVRYVKRDKHHSWDISKAEIAGIHAANLGLMLVQHVDDEDWKPSISLGYRYGQNAVDDAQSVGYPKGCNLWLDLESVGASGKFVADYCNAWYSIVNRAGYIPGIYIGYDPGLNNDELFKELKFQYYWEAYNADNIPSHRGYCMRQFAYPSPDHRVKDIPFQYDIDIIKTDNLGNSPKLWLP